MLYIKYVHAHGYYASALKICWSGVMNVRSTFRNSDVFLIALFYQTHCICVSLVWVIVTYKCILHIHFCL